MSQTSAPQIEMDKGFAGQLADSHGPKDVLTSKAIAAAIGLGLLAVVDSANGDGAIKVPSSAADITNLTKGVVMHAHSQEVNSGSTPNWPIKSAVPTLTKGRIYVEVEDAVAEGAPVFARYAAGAGGTVLGKFRSDVDTASAAQVPGAIFRSSTTGAGIAVVELNLPA